MMGGLATYPGNSTLIKYLVAFFWEDWLASFIPCYASFTNWSGAALLLGVSP